MTIVEARPKKRRRWLRRSVWLAVVLGYMALLWYVVFPWVDKTFVNRPAL